MRRRGRYWEEFETGRSWLTGWRTVTADDLAACAAVSRDRNPLHADDEFARAAGFEGRIAPGVLGLAVVTGLLNRLGLTAGTLVALAGVAWRFERPLYPGQRVRARLTVAATRETRRPDRGIVVLHATLESAPGTVHQSGELTLLVRRRMS